MELADNLSRANELYASGLSKLNDDNNFDGAVKDMQQAHEFYMLASKEKPENFRVWLGLINTLIFVAYEDEPEEITQGTLKAYMDIAVQKAENAEDINEIQNAYNEALSLTVNSAGESLSGKSGKVEAEEAAKPPRRIKISPHILIFGIVGAAVIAVFILLYLLFLYPLRSLLAGDLPPIIREAEHAEIRQPEPLQIYLKTPELKRSDLDRINPLNNRTNTQTNSRIDSSSERSIRGTNINIRSRPNTSSEIITRLNEGNHVTVLESQGEWSRIRMQNGQTGWVSGKYLQGRINAWAKHGGDEMKIKGTKVNVRSSASKRSRVITQLNDGDLVEVTNRSSEWCYIYTLSGSEGWVHSDYVRQ